MKLQVLVLSAATVCACHTTKPPSQTPPRIESILMAREGGWFATHPKAVVVIDGRIVEWTEWTALKPEAIVRQYVEEPAQAVARYGPLAADGALVVVTKAASSKAP